MLFILENEEQDRDTSGKFDGEWGTEKAIDVSDGRLYHKVMIGSKKGCDIGNMWQIVENDTFCGKN